MTLTPGVVINRTKSDVCTPSSLGRVKAHIRTHMYIFATYVRFDDVPDPPGQPPPCYDQPCQV